MTTMVALVGEQALPNFLPVRYYHPTDVLFVYTSRTQSMYERLKNILQSEVNVHGLETDAYNIHTTIDAINIEIQNIDALVSQPPVFNFTGGTKMMSLAAYQVAQQHHASMIYMQSEGNVTKIYHYDWKNGQLQSPYDELLPGCVTLHDVLNLFLGEEDVMWKIDKPNIEGGAGHLFELAIAKVLQEDDQDYEVICGVKDIRGQIDIDVMVRYRNNIAIMEAKTGKRASGLKGIMQLSNAQRYLGGTYTKLFLTLDRQPFPDQKSVCQALRVNIISLLGYQEMMTDLIQEDASMLLAILNEKLK